MCTRCLQACRAFIVVSALQASGSSAQTDATAEASQAADPPAEARRIGRADHRLEWHFKRVHWAEIVTAAALGATAFGVSRIDTPTPRWTRVNSFDDWVRDGLRLDGQAAHRVDVTSDVLEITLLVYPFAVDSIGVALIGDRNPKVFGQLTLVQAQAFAWSSFLTSATKVAVRRQRPFAQECPDGPACGDDTNRSFFSGHTSIAFTSAGLTCAAHLHLHLYGRVGDALACATTLTLASATGLFRIMADEHWATDVIIGAGVGLFSGWLLPWLLHFRHDTAIPNSRAARALRLVAPYGSPRDAGLRVTGQF